MCVCVCVCVCVCSPRSVPCLSHSLTTLVTHTHIHNSLTLFWLHIFHCCICGIQAQDNSAMCVLPQQRAVEMLSICNTHTIQTYIKLIVYTYTDMHTCMSMYKYFILMYFVYHPLNYCIHCYQQDLYMGTCSREWLQRMSDSLFDVCDAF